MRHRQQIARLAVVTALLAVAALGTAARQHASLSAAGLLGPAARPVVRVLGIALLGCAAVVFLAVLLVRSVSSGREEEEPGSAAGLAGARRLIFLAFMVPVGLLLLVAAGLVVLSKRTVSARSVSPVLPGPHRAAGPPGQHLPAGAAIAVVAASLVLVAAGLAVLGWLSRRAAAQAGQPGPAGRAPLAAAVTAGHLALLAAGDARAAIINCYAAMEDSLAAAGSPRGAADSPEELLERAAGDGIVRTPSARRLTAMFLQARYSRHPVTDDQRRAALDALEDITADLGGGR